MGGKRRKTIGVVRSGCLGPHRRLPAIRVKQWAQGPASLTSRFVTTSQSAVCLYRLRSTSRTAITSRTLTRHPALANTTCNPAINRTVVALSFLRVW